MKTYQDLIALNGNESERRRFILAAIAEHKGSDEYKTAYDAELYYKHQNPTIMNFQKFVYNQFGQKVPDIWSPNNKIASNWYNFFVTQGVSYLLGNGVTFGKDDTKEKLGKDFDKRVNDIATAAINGSVAFGMFDRDRVVVFNLTEFVPLYDEENGSLRAGIRFWQIDDQRPLRATLYEEDGYTEYIKRKNDDGLHFLDESAGKRKYIEVVKTSEIDGSEIYGGRNYPTFPIIPMWNRNHVSELDGNRGTIDAYDLMMSGLINNVSDGELIYWLLKNAGGMTPEDDARFVEQLKLTHVVHVDGDDGGADAAAHQATVPFEASAEALDRLKEQLFKDFMALDVSSISANATNDQIQAAYEPLNQKTDALEYEVTQFIKGILAVAGIDDEPTYTRSQMSNRKETLDMVLSAAQYLPEEYVTQKIITLLGDADKFESIMAQKIADEGDRYDRGTDDPEKEEEAADAKNGGTEEGDNA